MISKNCLNKKNQKNIIFEDNKNLYYLILLL